MNHTLHPILVQSNKPEKSCTNKEWDCYRPYEQGFDTGKEATRLGFSLLEFYGGDIAKAEVYKNID